MSTFRRDSNGHIVPAFIPGATQAVAIGSGSVQSTATGINTTFVRVVATVDCHVELGSNPTASQTTSLFLPAGVVEYLPITIGWKVATIQKASGSTGSLFVTEAG